MYLPWSTGLYSANETCLFLFASWKQLSIALHNPACLVAVQPVLAYHRVTSGWVKLAPHLFTEPKTLEVDGLHISKKKKTEVPGASFLSCFPCFLLSVFELWVWKSLFLICLFVSTLSFIICLSCYSCFRFIIITCSRSLILPQFCPGLSLVPSLFCFTSSTVIVLRSTLTSSLSVCHSWSYLLISSP